MRTNTQSAAGWTVGLVVIVAVVSGGAGPARSAATEAGQAAEPQRIEVILNDFSISPNPLRIPAGRAITLVIRNVGKIDHEVMAGREPTDDTFASDLFGGVQVHIEPVSADSGTAGHEDAHAPSEEHAAAEHQAAEGHAAHAEGGEHGTMVQNKSGETFHMTFTLPESKRGTWASACFMPGHYNAGMHGTVIVDIADHVRTRDITIWRGASTGAHHPAGARRCRNGSQTRLRTRFTARSARRSGSVRRFAGGRTEFSST